jgi:hypothetical protein
MAKFKLASIRKTEMHKIMGDVKVIRVPITRKQFKSFEPFLCKCVQEEGTVYTRWTAAEYPTYCAVCTIWRATNIDDRKVS